MVGVSSKIAHVYFIELYCSYHISDRISSLRKHSNATTGHREDNNYYMYHYQEYKAACPNLEDEIYQRRGYKNMVLISKILTSRWIKLEVWTSELIIDYLTKNKGF